MPPTTRRATRSASLASMEMEADTTPARQGSRFGPSTPTLPALQSKYSFAYGSPAQPSMPDVVSVEQDDHGLADALQVGAGTAHDRDEDSDAEPEEYIRRTRRGTSIASVASYNSRVGRGPAKRRPSPIAEERDYRPNSISRPAVPSSGTGAGKSYLAEGGVFGGVPSSAIRGPASAASVATPRYANPIPPFAPLANGPAVHARRPAAVPMPVRDGRIEMMRRYIYDARFELLRFLLWMLALGMIACAIFIWPTFSFSSLPNFIQSGGQAITSAVVYPVGSLVSFLSAASHVRGNYSLDGLAINRLDSRVSVLEADVLRLQNQVRLHDTSLQKLEDILPEVIWVARDKKTKTYEIPNDFWAALKEKIQTDFGQSPSGRSGRIWDSFLSKNSARVQASISDEFAPLFEKAMVQHQLISKSMFYELLQENYATVSGEIKKLSEDFEAKYKHVDAEIESKSSAVALRVSKGILKKSLPSAQLEAVAQANLIRNSDKALKHVNFFSPGLGAAIDPYLTSPTKDKKSAFLQRRAAKLLGLRASNPPIAALLGWDDVADCWCTPSASGKAQLAVLLSHEVYPTEITVEHIPATATLDIEHAPKQLELWAEVKDDSIREMVGRASASLYGEDDIEVDKSLGKTFVRISRFEYDIDALNHVQTFGVDINMKGLNAAVSKVVVRAKSNWGSDDFTCFYRLRLHGTLAGVSLGPN